MKYEATKFPTMETKIEDNATPYVVELGTYLPIKKRVEDLRKAGMDLMAYRQAYSEFANGTQDLDLDDYDNELLGADELDFLQLKKRYFDVMKQAEKQKQEAFQAFQKKAHDEEVKKAAEALAKASQTNDKGE